jgi:RNA methyltransferase, TrmH family
MFNKTHTKYIQSLHHKKFRDQQDAFIAEGPKLVLELLNSGVFVCERLFVLNDWLQNNAKLLEKMPVKNIIGVKDFELEKISLLTTPNTLLAVFKKKEPTAPVDITDKITLVLDGIQDPGNLGTILRTADWFGIQNIICSPQCADVYNPKVIQGTMGSMARVNVFYTDLLPWLQNNNHIKKYATTLNGKNVHTINKLKEAIIIIGNEGQGVSDAVLELVNERITIPGRSEAESLNAAVAAGIVLAVIQ